MAYWDAQDSYYILLRRWLDAFRSQQSLTDSYDKAWRPQDSVNNIYAKLLRSHCEAFGIAEPNQLNYRFNDTENDLLRKILGALRVGLAGLPAGPAYEWRVNDSDRDIMAKILRCICIDAANTNPQNDFLPLDSEMDCLRKIVGIY